MSWMCHSATLFLLASWLLSASWGAVAATTSIRTLLRPLGGYEKLLSRKTPGTPFVSLSHGSVFVLDRALDGTKLVQAVARTMARHPLLRSRITSQEPESGGAGFESERAWAYCDEDNLEVLAGRSVYTATTVPSAQFEGVWRAELEKSLNEVEFPEAGPLWRLAHLPSVGQSALVFTFNHATDDQQSLHIILRDVLREYERIDQGKQAPPVESLPFPASVEEAVAPGAPTGNTIRWALFQLFNAIRGPVMIPLQVTANLKADPARYAAYANPDTRRTFIEPFTLPNTVAIALRAACNARNNTVTSILAAAMLCTTAAAIQRSDSDSNLPGADKAPNPNPNPTRDMLLRFLLSVDLRPYGAVAAAAATATATSVGAGQRKGLQGRGDWAGGTVACAAGAVDFDVPVAAAIASYGSPQAAASLSSLAAADKAAMHENMWNLAARCRNDATEVIEYSRFVPESVRLFGLGMKYAKVLQVVELDAKSSASLGRGYSCGVSNMGLVQFDSGIQVRQAFYGTSHARNGVLCQLSCMTTGPPGKEQFFGTLQFTDPIITRGQGAAIRQALCDLLTEVSQP